MNNEDWNYIRSRTPKYQRRDTNKTFFSRYRESQLTPMELLRIDIENGHKTIFDAFEVLENE
jgi:hypothetical protein